jgi:acetyl esterase/lipase
VNAKRRNSTENGVNVQRVLCHAGTRKRAVLLADCRGAGATHRATASLLILAGKDSLHDEGAQFAKNLTAAGVDIELHDFENSAHGFTYKRSIETNRACALMAKFINQNKKGE